MLKQRTVAEEIRTTGVGLHSGAKVELVLRPMPEDTGIVFRRTDLPEPKDFPVDAFAVTDTRMATSLERDGAKISTVEHLMSALCGLGIDNLRIDVSAPEIPIMDGSANAFVFLIQQAGVREQDAPKRFIRVLETVEVREGDKWAKLEPHFGYRIAFGIEFNNPAIDSTGKFLEIDFAKTSYVKEIARARTFGFMHEVEAMRSAGLGRGGSFDNAIVVDESRVLNREGLRYDDEFVKHKMLDAIGDLYLAGKPLIGAYSAWKGGHALNNQLVRALLSDPSKHEIVEFAHAKDAPADYATAGLSPAALRY